MAANRREAKHPDRAFSSMHLRSSAMKKSAKVSTAAWASSGQSLTSGQDVSRLSQEVSPGTGRSRRVPGGTHHTTAATSCSMTSPFGRLNSFFLQPPWVADPFAAGLLGGGISSLDGPTNTWTTHGSNEGTIRGGKTVQGMPPSLPFNLPPTFSFASGSKIARVQEGKLKKVKLLKQCSSSVFFLLFSWVELLVAMHLLLVAMPFAPFVASSDAMHLTKARAAADHGYRPDSGDPCAKSPCQRRGANQ